MPNSDATLSQLDNYDNNVNDIRKLQNLVQTISNSTEGQGDVDTPTITLAEDWLSEMSYRPYKKGVSQHFLPNI